MIDACFNELSVRPYCIDDSEVNLRVSTFVDLLKVLRSLGIKHVFC